MGMDLAEGSKAPAFMLPRDGGGSMSLADFKGRTLVLYFYPKADTPGCTREAIDFSRLHGEFQKAGADILGVSADAVAAQDKFKTKHDLTIALGSDQTHKMLEAYRVWGKKSMYGKTFMGITRATFLIGGDGRIARILAQGQGRRQCRRGADCSQSSMTSTFTASCCDAMSTDNLRKINHNPLELERVSAGVRSSDVGDRRGCVNVSTVVIVLPPKRLFGSSRRWPDAARDRRRGARLRARPCRPPVAPRADRLLGGGRHTHRHGAVDHRHRHVFRLPRGRADAAHRPAGGDAIRLRGPHRRIARAGRPDFQPAAARPGTARAEARSDPAPAGGAGIARLGAERAARSDADRLEQAAGP